MVLLDDYSKRIDVYVLKNKSDARAAFEEYRAHLERESGEKIVTLRSDQGGEFKNSAMDQMCRSLGIVHQYSDAYKHQQNGAVERPNRTLLAGVKANLAQGGLGKAFWAEALFALVHVYNRSPHSALGGATPLGVWSGKTPSLAHLRAFGCRAWLHIPKETRKHKLDDSGKAMILVGYSTTSPTRKYRLWDPLLKPSSRQGIIETSSCKFDETVFPLVQADNELGGGRSSEAPPPSVCPNTTSTASAGCTTLTMGQPEQALTAGSPAETGQDVGKDSDDESSVCSDSSAQAFDLPSAKHVKRMGLRGNELQGCGGKVQGRQLHCRAWRKTNRLKVAKTRARSKARKAQNGQNSRRAQRGRVSRNHRLVIPRPKSTRPRPRPIRSTSSLPSVILPISKTIKTPSAPLLPQWSSKAAIYFSYHRTTRGPEVMEGGNGSSRCGALEAEGS